MIEAFPTRGAFEGEILIESKWVPDINELYARMMQASHEYENIELPLLRVREILIEDTRRRFDTETDPQGDKWAELDPVYAASKAGYGYPENILVRTGDLKNYATSESAWPIVGDSVFFFYGLMPKYGEYHQTGKGDAGNWGKSHKARMDILNTRESIAQGLVEPEAQGGMHDKFFEIGRGRALPQRAFIGISDEALGELEVMFDAWAAGIMDEVFVGEEGGVPAFGGGFMLRGAGGRFTGVQK